jgi:ABC-type transport system involved in Fe-S cluster assembly fused permease/ATPase subunit
MEKFDSIYLLEKGEIVVSGKHVDLLNISSEYRKYFL